MKKFLLKTALFIPIVIGMSYMSCKPDSFTEEDAMLLQSKLEKEMILLQDSLKTATTILDDSLDKDFQKITYTLSLVDAYKSTMLSTSSKGVSAASVTMTQGGTVVSKTTDVSGVAMFDNLQKGLATLHVVLTGYSEVNAVINFAFFGVGTSVNGGIQFGNVLPMIPISGTSTGTIKGKVTCESDLTNKVPESVPTGTKVIATVDPSSSALNNIGGGIIESISYDNLSLQALTDVNGDFVMTVPATSMGLDYSLRVSDFAVNQSLLMLTKGGVPVTGVQTVSTNFGSGFSSVSSSIPSVNPVIVTIGAPDYTYTQATATAVVSNPNGLDYIQTTNAGNYYDAGNTFYFSIDDPAPAAGGTNAIIGTFVINSSGQIPGVTITTKGSGYSTGIEGTTFTLPYIKSAARAVVVSVNGSGAITSWRISSGGQFYSRTNLEFVRSTGSGTGAVLTLPAINDLASNYLYFDLATYPQSPAIGLNYAVNDEFTLAIKSGMSNVMTGKIHMTTGSVTAMNILTDGTNYITNKVNVVIASPGLTGATATATATVSNGRISAINVGFGGSNYSSAPVVTILNEVEKIQAKYTATITDGNITALPKDVAGIFTGNVGNGYLTVPSVTITPGVSGMGTGASAVAVLTNGTVSSLNLVNGGSGFTGVNTPATAANAPASTAVSVIGSGTTIVNINLGTGKRSIED
ncbi:MAG: hypothetical protein NT144_02635 [Bacteroidia bacterium]|nr:hypothetical protein [Bacteroidia bacterium]